MQKEKIFKTSNFNNPGPWIKRIFFVCAFGYLIYARILPSSEFGFGINFLFITILIFIILAGQIDELEINETEIIIQQNSLIPFLRSSRSFKISDIDKIRKNSNYIEGQGIWSLILKRRAALELIFKNGSTEIISSKLHPNGIDGLMKELEKNKTNTETDFVSAVANEN